jgi:hypothetical protein
MNWPLKKLSNYNKIGWTTTKYLATYPREDILPFN